MSIVFYLFVSLFVSLFVCLFVCLLIGKPFGGFVGSSEPYGSMRGMHLRSADI